MDRERIKRAAVAAAYKGAAVLKAHFGNLRSIEKKGAIDLVTEADLASEKVIVDTIRNQFPDHGILAEESGLAGATADNRWIVDPLDGTTNFAHRLPLFCISIAFASRGEVVCGVVLNPATEELFSAAAGEGATLNGAPITVSDTAVMRDSLLVTGFPYDIGKALPEVMARFSRCVAAAQGVRRLGSAALDLCYLACGRFEAYWEQHLHPWDTAAGWLIAREAGASVTDFRNAPYHIDRETILASNGKIHREMVALLDIEETT